MAGMQTLHLRLARKISFMAPGKGYAPLATIFDEIPAAGVTSSHYCPSPGSGCRP